MNSKTTEADSKIISAIKDYVDEDIYRYAVLLDGEWGCGKTYFAKGKLYDELKKHEEEKKSSSSKYKPRRIQYISLYGISSLEAITSQIMLDSYFEGRKKRLKKFIDYGKELTNNVLPLVFNIINPIIGLGLEHENIRQIFKIFISTKEKILVFDDLERCNSPIDQILGYINSLVEHCGMKVIIIANEREIGKAHLNEVNSANDFYGNVKEKLIGVTLQYCPDLKDTLSVLISNMSENTNIEEKSLKNLLESQLPFFEELMDKTNHHNLRTFQFFLAKIDKIYTTIMEGDENAIKNEIFMQHIVQYCFAACILIKMNIYNLKWEPAQLCYVYSVDRAINRKNWAFRFIEDFLKNGILDKDMAVATFNHYSELEYINDHTLQTLLSNWYISDEKTVDNSIGIIIEKIENCVYPMKDFPKIIILFIELEQIGFTGILDKMTSAMKNCTRNIQEHVIPVETYSLMLEGDIKRQFEEVVAKIQEELDRRIELQCALNTYLQKGDGWAKDLHDYVIEHIFEINISNGFLVWFDIDCLLKKLEKSSSKDLFYFRSSFLMLYINRAMGEALLSELPQIKALKDKIEKMDKTNFDKIKRMQINYLIENLENAINLYPAEKISD